MNTAELLQHVTRARTEVVAERRLHYCALVAKWPNLSIDEALRLGVEAEKNHVSDDELIRDISAGKKLKRVILRCRPGLDVQHDDGQTIFICALATGTACGPEFAPKSYEFIRAPDQPEAEFTDLVAIAEAMPASSHSNSVSNHETVAMLIQSGIPKAWAERAASRHTQAQVELALVESHVRVRVGRAQNADRWLRTEIGVPLDAIDPKAAPKPIHAPGQPIEKTSARESYRAAIENRTGARAT